MEPVQLDVIANIPEGWGFCNACEIMIGQSAMDDGPYNRGLDDYPQEWQEEFRKISDLLLTLSARYADRIQIRVFDPFSLPGLWKAIRHGVHQYPTFIISGKQKITGYDLHQLEQALQAHGAVPG